MKYHITVEMNGKENIDLLCKAMEIMSVVPNVVGVSLVDVEDGKETLQKHKINRLVANLEAAIRDLKNEVYMNVSNTIHYLSRAVREIRFWALSSDKSFSCVYAEDRLYLVRKMFGEFPVYMFVEAESSKAATDKAIAALKKHTIDGYVIVEHEEGK